MQITIFVIDGLLENKYELVNKKLINCYIKWNEMYTISHYDNFTETDLKEFDVSIKKTLKLKKYKTVLNLNLIIYFLIINFFILHYRKLKKNGQQSLFHYLK